MSQTSSAATGAVSGAPTPEPPQPHQEITRHLAAAVHLKPGFAARVIDTYVSAPQEALPPAPGVDARVVLTQALIARHRRGIRDALILSAIVATGLLLLLADPGFALFWIGFWILWTVVSRTQGTYLRSRGEESAATLGVLWTVLLWLLWFALVSAIRIPVAISTASYTGISPLPGNVWSVLLALLGTAAVYLVLSGDKLVLQHLLARHGSEQPPAEIPPRVEALSVIHGLR